MAIIDNIVSGVWLLIHAWGVQFIKYTLVAVAGLLLHIGILTGLVELVNVHYTLAFLAALPFTFGGKFLLDKYWTFANGQPSEVNCVNNYAHTFYYSTTQCWGCVGEHLARTWAVQFIKYTLVAVAGLLLHIGILTGLVELVNVHYTLAFLAALPFTFGGKFLLDKYWTFTNESKPLGKMLRGGHERSGGKLVA